MSQPISFRRNEALTTIRQEWKGNPVVKGKFINQQHHVKHGIGSVLKWRLSPNPQRKEKRREKWNPEIRFLHSLEKIKGDALVWLGHNSFFMQFGGKKLLFDPVFGHIPFVRRRSNLPVNPRIFKDIDYLLISHDHFDHLDKKSIALLFSNNSRMKVFCGLGVGELLRSWFPSIQVIEAGWYQQIEDNGLKITFLPAQHWGKRSFADGGQRLWGAFMLEKNGLSLYYSGDTGYAKHFSEIKELFGSPDYALLGIGAYKPRWFMQPNHISPHDSIKAATEMGAKTTIPMHYGTFDLSDEPLSDPPKVFAEEAQKHKVNIYIPVLGEVVSLK